MNPLTPRQRDLLPHATLWAVGQLDPAARDFALSFITRADVTFEDIEGLDGWIHVSLGRYDHDNGTEPFGLCDIDLAGLESYSP